jgi:phosphoglycerol transferase
MTTKDSPEATPFAWRAAMLASFAAVFAYLLYRNLGLNPAIFADEWYYSKMSRLMPLSEAILPSYLYLWVFRASNVCGNGFLDCVRVGNAVLFVGAAPFIYLCARQFTDARRAWAVALLAILAPVNLHTVFFMPESAYYFGFWVMSWMVLTRSDSWSWRRLAAASGALLGLVSLVKVHALFLVPALCLFLLYIHWTRGGRWREGLLAMALAALATFAVKLGLGYLLAGDAALTLLGSFYSGSRDAAHDLPLRSLLGPAFVNGRAHLMALAVLLGLPLAVLAYSLAGRAARGRRGDRLDDLHLYTLLMLGCALGMTVAFTASIAHHGPTEVLRLHMRYYNLVFPLLFMVAAATPGADGDRRALRAAIAFGVALLVALGVWKLPLYVLASMDGPEIASFSVRDRWGTLLVALQLLALLLWVGRSRRAAPLFLYAVLPLMAAAGLYTNYAYTRQLTFAWGPENGGRYAQRHVPKAEQKLITVAGAEMAELMRAAFYIDNKDVAFLPLEKNAPIASYQLPVHNKWLLVIGPHALPPGIQPVAATSEFALVRVGRDTRRIGLSMLSRPYGDGPVAGAEGLSHAEPWGRWSVGERVVFHFKEALPRHLSVTLKARAFGPNQALPFTLRAGEKQVDFRLSNVQQDIGLRIETDGRQRSLVIDVPRPVSPAELGQSSDSRKLGIGIAAIEIGR